MELPSEEGEIPTPIPINSTYGEGHEHTTHHDHHQSSTPQITSINGGALITSTLLVHQDHHMHALPYKKVIIKYKECLKNHAASMGGNAIDGCGEFMPSGEDGTLEALICSACNCHRNFHRKEIEGPCELSSCDYYNPNSNNPHHLNRVSRKIILGHHHHHNNLGFHPSRAAPPPQQPQQPPRPPPPHRMMMPYNLGFFPCESDEQEDVGGVVIARQPYNNHQGHVKKRFRTKFSYEQKEKMLQFAEKIGWKIQKQEENVVQQFCQEIGIKRRVLKVWMHNNKHTLAKKVVNNSNVQDQV